MKAGVTPELSQKWWRSNKPTTLKSTGLGKALGDHEKVVAELEKALKAGGWPRIQAAIDECDRHTGSKLPAAVKKARGMCDKKKHAETIAALDKYDAVFRQEATRLAALVGPVRRSGEALVKKLGTDAARIKGVAEPGLKQANKLEASVRGQSSDLDRALREVSAAAGRSDKGAMQAAAKKADACVDAIAKGSKALRDLADDVRAARRSWDFRPGKTDFPGEAEFAKFGDQIETIQYGLEGKADDAEEQLATALTIQQDIHRIFRGESDERAMMKQSCERMLKLRQREMAGLDAAARTLGGDLGNARADVLNTREMADRDAQVERLKKLIARTVPFDKQSRKLDQRAKDAVTSFAEELKGLPDYVSRDAEFSTAWSALQKLQSGLDGVAKDAAATVTDAAKYTRDVKALAVELKKDG